MGTLGSGRYAPYAQRPHGRFVHHVEGHKPGRLITVGIRWTMIDEEDARGMGVGM